MHLFWWSDPNTRVYEKLLETRGRKLFENKGKLFAAFLDLRQAFDTVSHKTFIKLLSQASRWGSCMPQRSTQDSMFILEST
jgi:hypothetical protein